MYKITVDDEILYDLRIEDKKIVNPVLNLELNTSGSLTFSIPPTNNTSINLLNGVIKVFDDDIKIYEGRVLDYTKDFYNNKQMTCEGILAYFLDSVVRPYEYHDMSVSDYLNTLINNHNSQVENEKKFTLGNVTVIDNNDSLYRKNEGYTNTLNEINEKLIKRLGGYLVIREENEVRYLDYLSEINNTNSQVIRFGENLLDISQYLNAETIRTVIIPIGKDGLTISDVNNGKDYLESSTGISLYGKIWDIVKFDDVTIASNLKSKGQAYLDGIVESSLTLELNAIDLNLINVDVEKIKLGDTLRVLSKPHGLDKYMQVTKMTINLEDPSQNSITLGKTVTGIIENTVKDKKDINEVLGSKMNTDRFGTMFNQTTEEFNFTIGSENGDTNVIMDKTGLTVKNGAIAIKNSNNEVVMTVDKDGNLTTNRLMVVGDGSNTVQFTGKGSKFINLKSNDGGAVFVYFGTGNAVGRVGTYPNRDEIFIETGTIGQTERGKIILRGINSTQTTNEPCDLEVHGNIGCTGVVKQNVAEGWESS